MAKRWILTVVLLAAFGLGAFALWARGVSAKAPIVAGLGGEARAFGVEARRGLTSVGHELLDVKLTASVKTALGLNRTLRPYSIDVGSEDGVVSLRGRVHDAGDRARAEAIAAAVPGVERVVDEIEVAAAPPPAPGRTLGESLDDETLDLQVRLALSLNRALRGADITVQSYRREVTLGGEVASQAQRQQALETARDTVGVASVVDRIRLQEAAAGTGAPSAEREGSDSP